MLLPNISIWGTHNGTTCLVTPSELYSAYLDERLGEYAVYTTSDPTIPCTPVGIGSISQSGSELCGTAETMSGKKITHRLYGLVICLEGAPYPHVTTDHIMKVKYLTGTIRNAKHMINDRVIKSYQLAGSQSLYEIPVSACLTEAYALII